MKSPLDRPELQPAAKAFAKACEASRIWSSKLASLRQHYGIPDTAPHVSGVGIEGLTEPRAAEMRGLAETVSRESDRAYALRPRGVRMSTMRALASAVARRDGSGFYGPQP